MINDKLICNRTWEDIKKMQQKKPLLKNSINNLPVNNSKRHPRLPEFKDMYKEHGLRELKDKGFHGVIDILQRAGVIKIRKIKRRNKKV